MAEAEAAPGRYRAGLSEEAALADKLLPPISPQ